MVEDAMDITTTVDDGEWMSRGEALRLAAAVLSGPVIVLSLLKVDWQPFEAWSGPLWLDLGTLIDEAIHAYGLTLMVAISICLHRLLLPARFRAATFLLPVMLWGVQSAFFSYGAIFNFGHWQAEYVLFLVWLLGIVTFGVLGLVLVLTLPSGVTRESGQGVARVDLRKIVGVGVVVATVFLDWTLVSTQATELSAIPILESVEEL